MEKRIYLIDCRDTLYVDALIPTLPDKAFAEEAERQGNAYTLDEFLDEYNVKCMKCRRIGTTALSTYLSLIHI